MYRVYLYIYIYSAFNKDVTSSLNLDETSISLCHIHVIHTQKKQSKRIIVVLLLK